MAPQYHVFHLAVVRIRWYHLCQVLRTVSNTQSVLATTIMIPANSGSLQVRTGHLEDPCLPPRLQGPCLASQPSPGVALRGEWGQSIGRHSPEQSFKQQCPETQTLEDFSGPKAYRCPDSQSPLPTSSLKAGVLLGGRGAGGRGDDG